MKACVAAMESTTQSSVQCLPRRFGDAQTVLDPPGFSSTEQRLSMYDGGSELNDFRMQENLSEDSQNFLDGEVDADWRRPKLELRDSSGKVIEQEQGMQGLRESVYSRTLNSFQVAKFPSYRRTGVMRSEETAVCSEDHVDSEEWKRLFGADVRSLVTEVLIHICGESCFKYSGKGIERICRHGFYYIIELTPEYRRRRRGKQLRNVLFIVKKNTFGMQGRIMGFQQHPFECQSNFVGTARTAFFQKGVTLLTSPWHPSSHGVT